MLRTKIDCKASLSAELTDKILINFHNEVNTVIQYTITNEGFYEYKSKYHLEILDKLLFFLEKFTNLGKLENELDLEVFKDEGEKRKITEIIKKIEQLNLQ